WEAVKEPENWPYLLGAMTPAEREELAQAYERGDIVKIGRLTGARIADLPSGGGMGSIAEVKKLGKSATGSHLTDLTDHRATHILNRHRAGSGISGKTEFP